MLGAITRGTLTLDLRPRLEFVDQDGEADTARAGTLRVLVGWHTTTFHGSSFYAEAIDVGHLEDEFNDQPTASARYPTVTDPENSDINQGYVDDSKLTDTRVRAGRASLEIDNVRDVGHVEFRQVMQVFNGVMIAQTSLTYVENDYAHFERVKNVFAWQRQTRIDLLHGAWTRAPEIPAVGLAYLRDQPGTGQATGLADDANRILRVRLNGAQPIGGAFAGFCAAEFTRQSAHADGDRCINAGDQRIGAGGPWDASFVRLETASVSAATTACMRFRHRRGPIICSRVGRHEALRRVARPPFRNRRDSLRDGVGPGGDLRIHEAVLERPPFCAVAVASHTPDPSLVPVLSPHVICRRTPMMLQGQTIAVLESRAAEQVAALVARHGGKPLSAPALGEIPVIDTDDVRQWLAKLTAMPPAVSIFQTGVGTRALLEAAAAAGVKGELVALIEGSTVVVRGPKPTAALRVAGIRIDRSASEPFTTEDVLERLADVDLAGKTVLVQRYGESNEKLMTALSERGARALEVPVYQWTLPPDVVPLHRLFDAIDAGNVDAIVFTSASQVRNLLEVAQQAGRELSLRRGLVTVPIVSIGPVCSAALRAAGFDVRSEASPPKLGHLMTAIAVALGRTGP